MRKKILLIILALFALPWLAHAQAAIGQPAPALVVTQLDGQAFDLAAQRGKVVIVNVWASWCAPCRAEMPALDAAYKRYQAKGVVIIGLSADRAKHRDDVTGIMKQFSYPAAMLSDAKSNDFGWPTSLPVTYVIDRDGIVRSELTPDQALLTGDVLDKILQPLLAP